MSGIIHCTSCKKNIDIGDFIENDKILKTCITCRNRKSYTRKKNICGHCGIRAIYNFENEKYGVSCSKHKEIGMVNVNHKTCEHEGCKIHHIYNF